MPFLDILEGVKRSILAVVLLVGLGAGLVYAGQAVVVSKHRLTYAVSAILRPIIEVVKAVVPEAAPGKSHLALENERLKAQILALSKSAYEKTIGGKKYIAAKVYSTYPFNNRDLLTINAGILQGVAKDMPVTLDGAVLIGQVAEVFQDYSIVMTVFDSGWKTPVKIGADSVDALFSGGREPRLTLIVKESMPKTGENVYTAGKEFPFGLTIGSVREVFDDKSAMFHEAKLSFPYDLSTVAEVAILVR